MYFREWKLLYSVTYCTEVPRIKFSTRHHCWWWQCCANDATVQRLNQSQPSSLMHVCITPPHWIDPHMMGQFVPCKMFGINCDKEIIIQNNMRWLISGLLKNDWLLNQIYLKIKINIDTMLLWKQLMHYLWDFWVPFVTDSFQDIVKDLHSGLGPVHLLVLSQCKTQCWLQPQDQWSNNEEYESCNYMNQWMTIFCQFN